MPNYKKLAHEFAKAASTPAAAKRAKSPRGNAPARALESEVIPRPGARASHLQPDPQPQGDLRSWVRAQSSATLQELLNIVGVELTRRSAPP